MLIEIRQMRRMVMEGRYTAEVYADAPDSEHSPKNVVVETRNVDRTMQLRVHLASGGGHAMRIRP